MIDRFSLTGALLNSVHQGVSVFETETDYSNRLFKHGHALMN